MEQENYPTSDQWVYENDEVLCNVMVVYIMYGTLWIRLSVTNEKQARDENEPIFLLRMLRWD